VSYPYNYPYRNIETEPRQPKLGPVLLIGIGALVCVCACIGLIIGAFWTGALSPASLPLLARATPTRDPNAPVALKTPTTMTSGLELTATGFQRPLKVQGAKIPDTEQFVLVTVRLKNTRATGAPLKVTLADFSLSGDGGLTYKPNPKGVEIKDLLTELDVAPGATASAELIFQIPSDDSGLRLIWASGGAKRTIVVEPNK